MKLATIRSVCECQARLLADVDVGGLASAGRAVVRGQTLGAPVNALNSEDEYFDVGWLCPFCGRNTLRSFYRGALAWRPASAETAA
ncbi:MAG: hypothetical protein SFV15_16730 [Polyangiaceae bacterium]|nr:hypothetical protein [Polyangiaceae bacterium]